MHYKITCNRDRLTSGNVIELDREVDLYGSCESCPFHPWLESLTVIDDCCSFNMTEYILLRFLKSTRILKNIITDYQFHRHISSLVQVLKYHSYPLENEFEKTDVYDALDAELANKVSKAH